MHTYTPGQWILLFFFYCLAGWIWECCYVSARQRKWVNRGFLNGPVLPIYGTGAILILFVTLPVKNNFLLVYLFGTAAATALEYVTGAVMEQLFKVRYWDYSYRKYNLNGYICLHSSVGWGFFSILLVALVHPPVSQLLARVPALAVNPLSLALSAVFAVDVVKSTQAALDLRALLIQLAEENEELRRIARRAEVISAFAEEDLRQFRSQVALEKQVLRRIRAAEKDYYRKQQLEWDAEILRRRQAAKLDVLNAIEAALERAQSRLEDGIDNRAEQLLNQHRGELEELLEKVRARKAEVEQGHLRRYRRSWRILRNHPTARAKAEFAEALEALRNMNTHH